MTPTTSDFSEFIGHTFVIRMPRRVVGGERIYRIDAGSACRLSSCEEDKMVFLSSRSESDLVVSFTLKANEVPSYFPRLYEVAKNANKFKQSRKMADTIRPGKCLMGDYRDAGEFQ